jgi:hypothetical protein
MRSNSVFLVAKLIMRARFDELIASFQLFNFISDFYIRHCYESSSNLISNDQDEKIRPFHSFSKFSTTRHRFRTFSSLTDLIDSLICLNLNKHIPTYSFKAFQKLLSSEAVFCSFCPPFTVVSCLLQHLNKARQFVAQEQDENWSLIH